MEKIKDFIKKNKISFEEGQRNTSVVKLVGYSQHLGITKNKLKAEVVDEIDKDNFIEQEIDRLWDYCNTNNYKAFWKTKEAKEKYEFA